MEGVLGLIGGSGRTLRPGALALLLLAASGPLFAQEDCSVLGQTSFVRDRMTDIYLWYREVPDVSPALYDSPEAYLEAVRYRPLDETFSFITLKATNDAFYSESQFIGFGFGTKLTGPEELRLSAVFPDSPAAEAGLARGDRLTAIDGRPVPDLIASGEVFSAFGPGEIGWTTELEWTTLSGEPRRATLVKRPVTIPTVSLTRVFDVDGRRVGYLHFRNFVRPSTEALDQAFTELRAAGADELVLDLRYNGGGLIDVARHLASLIGGVRTFVQVFTRFVHNDRNTARDQVYRFENPRQALDLARLVVITSRATASAGELLINGLRPFVDVRLVGDATYGKPVGQYGYEFCEKVVYPVSFSLRNARGEGDFFDGIPADCPAADDLDHALGDPEEAALAEALHVARAGACTPASEAAARALGRRAARERRPPGDGWQQLLGAH